jgi:hypothetical protein
MNHGLLLVVLGSQADEGEESEEEDGKGKKKCRASLFRTLLDAVLTGTLCHININNHQFLIVHITLW